MKARRRLREHAEDIEVPAPKRLNRSSVSPDSIVADENSSSLPAVLNEETEHMPSEKKSGHQKAIEKNREDSQCGIFSIAIWNNVNIAVFGRWMEQVRACLVKIIRNWPLLPSLQEDKSISVAMIKNLGEQMRLTWEARKYVSSLSSYSILKYNVMVSEGITQLVKHLEHLTLTYNDPLTLCRHYIRVMEEYGFMEDIDGDELGACIGGLKYALYPHGYAYSERGPQNPSTGSCNSNFSALHNNELPEGASSPPEGAPKVHLKGRGDHFPDDDTIKNHAFASHSSFSPPQTPSSPSSLPPSVSPSVSRVGYVVSLEHSPHLNPLVNTTIQLIEPRKRRPPLDEYRIFSHPKKATTHGVEDALVDEELHYRSLVVLIHHLDTYGSLIGLSPFARFCLYTSLDSIGPKFLSLHDKPASTQVVHQELQHLRSKLETKKYAEQQTRWCLRETAQRLGWYAVSAHWRDQVLAALQNVDETDWYGLSDTVRGGFPSARFPNYSCAKSVKTLMILVLEKLRNMKVGEVTGELASPTSPSALVVDTVLNLVLPLLEGELPTWCYESWKKKVALSIKLEGHAIHHNVGKKTPIPLTATTWTVLPSSVASNESEADSKSRRLTFLDMPANISEESPPPPHSGIPTDTWWLKVSTSLRRSFVKWIEHPPFAALALSQHALNPATKSRNAEESETTEGDSPVFSSFRCPYYMKEGDPEALGTLLIPSMVFPLQCVAELLEVCSSALHSVHGIDVFTKKFISQAPLESEESILEFLLQEEPTNVALTTLVAIPKIFEDLVCSLPVLFSDVRSLAISMEAKHIFSEMGASLCTSSLCGRNYAYWKLLSNALEKENSSDDLLFLFVKTKPFFELTPTRKPSETSSLRCYSEGILERVTKVWPQEVAEIIHEEEEWKKKHCL